jgi:hypothetical protein
LLNERGLALNVEPLRSRYVALDAAETLATFMGDDGPEPELFSGSVGALVERAISNAQVSGQRVTAYGEMVALLYAAGQRDEAVALEELWNTLGARHEFLLHCAYPSELFAGPGSAAALAAVCGAHSRVIPSEQFIAKLM